MHFLRYFVSSLLRSRNLHRVAGVGIAVICIATLCPATHADEPFQLEDDEVVALLGGTNIVNMQSAGYLETLLTLANPERRPRFLDYGWEGDTAFKQGTVIERWRKDKYGDLANQLKINGVTCVVIHFGQSESLEGSRGIDRFVQAYDDLLAKCRQRESGSPRRLVVISPIPFEKTDNRFLPDLSNRNDDLAEYVAAIEKLTEQHDGHFVDLFTHFTRLRHADASRLTDNGLHVSPAKQALVGTTSAQLLGVPHDFDASHNQLRDQVVRKHTLWMSYWRPANWKCLYGDDGEREFGKATAGGMTLRQEWMQLPALIATEEATIWKTAAKMKDQR